MGAPLQRPQGKQHSRRAFLVVSAPGMLGLPLLAVGSACSRAKAFSCMGTTGLSPAELELRHKIGYTDTAPKPELACRECAQYVEAAADGCGGCKVMPGPTHPDGYCKVFQAKA